MAVCQTYHAGHNVHWIQVSHAGPPVPAIVVPPPPDQWDLPDLAQQFRLYVEPATDPRDELDPNDGRTFVVHNAAALRARLADPSSYAAYSEQNTLLRVHSGQSGVAATFYPCFGEPTPCMVRSPGCPTVGPSLVPMDECPTVTQVQVGDAIGTAEDPSDEQRPDSEGAQ
ncbi:MAG: hypothetical protein WCP28_14185 [Actinomycetes bacterium]